MTWYKAFDFVETIEEIAEGSIIKETSKSVFFYDGRRDLKSTSYCFYSEDWEEAKNFIINGIKEKIDKLNQDLEYYKKKLEKVKQLKKEE